MYRVLVYHHTLTGTLPKACATHDRSGCEFVGAGIRRGFQDDIAHPAMALTCPFLKFLNGLSWKSAFYESEKSGNLSFAFIVKTIDLEQ